MPNLPFPYDFERVIDDWVFMCFFVGNDFLPRIYAYNIRERSIEKLIEGFKEHLAQAEAYLTDGRELNMLELLRLLGSITKYE